MFTNKGEPPQHVKRRSEQHPERSACAVGQEIARVERVPDERVAPVPVNSCTAARMPGKQNTKTKAAKAVTWIASAPPTAV